MQVHGLGVYLFLVAYCNAQSEGLSWLLERAAHTRGSPSMASAGGCTHHCHKMFQTTAAVESLVSVGLLHLIRVALSQTDDLG